MKDLVEEMISFDESEFDFDFDDREEEEHEIITLMNKIDDHAKKCITDFFEGKQWYCGGEIPNKELFAKNKINFIEQVELADAITLFHEQICLSLRISEEEYDNTIKHDSSNKILKIMKDCAERGIAQSRAGGMLLLHLDIIDGFNLDWEYLVNEAELRKEIEKPKDDDISDEILEDSLY